MVPAEQRSIFRALMETTLLKHLGFSTGFTALTPSMIQQMYDEYGATKTCALRFGPLANLQLPIGTQYFLQAT